MNIEGSPQQRCYGDTTLKGRAQAILGDSHVHHHYYGELSTRRAETHAGPSDGYDVTPSNGDFPSELVSDYDAVLARWLRSEGRLPNTCNWINDVPEYKRWRAGSGPDILFCRGSVGCGKSVTASAVLDVLDANAKTCKDTVVSYFVDTLRAHRIKVDDIFRALIKQLLHARQQSNSSLGSTLRTDLGRTFLTATAVPHCSQLLKLTRELCDRENTTYFVFDGIDALEEVAIIRLLKDLSILTNQDETYRSKCRILIFSRDSLGRGIRIDDNKKYGSFQIGLKHVEADVHAFIDHEVTAKQDERSLVQSSDLLDEVVKVLKDNSGKMFLWVKLQVATIWNPDISTCDADIREQLQQLPEGLDQTYIRCLRRIKSTQTKRSLEVAPKAFRWVASACRPLSEVEARELVSIKPDALPLTSDSILTLPVTDYCSNLVILNSLTGCLEFAHTTVRDLLVDGAKLPEDLSQFRLDTEDAMSWCATICVRYLEQHRSQFRMVKINRQKIPTRLSAPVLGTISDNLFGKTLRLRYLSWAATKANEEATNDEPDHVNVALPEMNSQHGLDTRDLKAHDYICQYWPDHTKQLQTKSPVFAAFRNLCLAQDAAIHPWVTTKVRRAEQYALAASYAVTTDHVPLLRILFDHLDQNGMRNAIFRGFCPGTDSTFLHLASALGNSKVLPLLMSCGLSSIANGQGKSAAAIALDAGHRGIFDTLLHDLVFESIRSPYHRLRGAKGVPLKENLLQQAVNANSIEVLESITLKTRCDEFYLTQALFIACEINHLEVARWLASHGADPNIYYSMSALNPVESSAQVSSLQIALSRGDPKLMENLFEIGATLKPRAGLIHPEIFDVVARYKGSEADPKADRFIKIMADHQTEMMIRGRSASESQQGDKSAVSVITPHPARLFLDIHLLHRIRKFSDERSWNNAFDSFGYLSRLALSHTTAAVLQSQSAASISEHITATWYSAPWLEMIIGYEFIAADPLRWNKYIRILLASKGCTRDEATRSEIRPLQNLTFRMHQTWLLYKARDIQKAFLTFLRFVQDDVLVCLIKQRIVPMRRFRDPEVLKALTMRGSSRGLQTVMQQYFTSRSLENLDVCCRWDYNALMYESANDSADPKLRRHPRGAFEKYLAFHKIDHNLDRTNNSSFRHHCRQDKMDSCAKFESWMLNHFEKQNQQFIIPLVAASLRQREFLYKLSEEMAKSSLLANGSCAPSRWTFQELVHAMRATSRMGILNSGPDENNVIYWGCMYMRCYLRTREMTKTVSLVKTLSECSSDANFTLNYPAGYTLDRNHRPVVKKEVTLALYAWNFRLRRRRKQPFSEADKWFIGLRIVIFFHPRTPWAKAVELPGSFPDSTIDYQPRVTYGMMSPYSLDLIWSRNFFGLSRKCRTVTDLICELHGESAESKPKTPNPLNVLIPNTPSGPSTPQGNLCIYDQWEYDK